MEIKVESSIYREDPPVKRIKKTLGVFGACIGGEGGGTPARTKHTEGLFFFGLYYSRTQCVCQEVLFDQGNNFFKDLRLLGCNFGQYFSV